MLASSTSGQLFTCTWGAFAGVAARRAARATASASESVTESTPGRAPAAVTQCTPSVGTPNARVSEVAYEVGFQSLTHFNRVFRKIVGESPTEYRHRLPRGR